MRFAATLAALVSVLLQAMLVVHVSGIKAQAAPSDPDAVAWAALTGAPICHTVQPEDDGKPDHAPKYKLCLICSAFQGTAPLPDAGCMAAFDLVEIALTFKGEAHLAESGTRPLSVNARGPPTRLV